MFGMKFLDTPTVFTILVVIAGWWFGRLGLLDVPGRRRLAIYGFVIVVAGVVFWFLVTHADGPMRSVPPASSSEGTSSRAIRPFSLPLHLYFPRSTA
jgi:hypothetical protein